jgi:hypothetical protein
MLAILVLRPGSAFSGSISWDLSGPPSKPKIFEIILKGCFLGAARTTGAKAKTWEALNIRRKLIKVFDMMMACFYYLVNEVVNKQQWKEHPMFGMSCTFVRSSDE